MNSATRRNPKSERKSLFFQDLASPVSVHRAGGRFTTPSQVAAVSTLWHENFVGPEPPPPPVFTLEDHVDFSPEPALVELPASPDLCSDSRTTKPSHGYFSSPSPRRSRADASSSAMANGESLTAKQQHQIPESLSWWSPANIGENEHDEKGRGSPVDGVVQPRELIMFPSLMEVVRPEMQRNSLPLGVLDDEEWVTVYGFAPGDTNLVLHEFEKCGTVLKHIPGPGEANWMHILYQNHYDAQRAFGKNGAQINRVLIVGVKPVDPSQQQYLNERLKSCNHANFPIHSFTPRSTAYGSSLGGTSIVSGCAAPQPSRQLNCDGVIASDGKGQRSAGAIASPAKSIVSKVIDLMFGI